MTSVLWVPDNDLTAIITHWENGFSRKWDLLREALSCLRPRLEAASLNPPSPNTS